MNDYDREGWVSMSHAEDRPLPTDFASYNDKSNKLSPENTELGQPIFIDHENATLFRDRSREIAYYRIP